MPTYFRAWRATLVLLAPLLASLASHAVYESASGLGQALIYPYYTVRSTDGNAFNTYISIGNGDDTAKALRVRFREGRNGREVAGFNLFLHAKAVWAAALIPGPAGARLLTRDPTCSIPAFTEQTGSAAFIDFSAALFTGNNADGLGTSEDRVREGYVEVLEMAALEGDFRQPGASGCTDVRAGRFPPLLAPRGWAYGTLTLINVASGMDFTLGAAALGNLAGVPFYRPPSDPYPDFNSIEIGRVASFLYRGKLYRIEMPTSLGAIEAAMAHRYVVNEIALDAATQSATDWVLTMPTRRFHANGISSPFFSAATHNGELQMGGSFLSRSGSALILTNLCGFLCPPNTQELRVQAPWTTTVMGFNATSGVRATSSAGTTRAFGSTNGWLIGLPDPGAGGAFEWQFENSGTGPPSVAVTAITTDVNTGAVATERIRLYGLPLVGFMARTLSNGTLTCGAGSCQGNYGGSVPHRQRRDIGAQ